MTDEIEFKAWPKIPRFNGLQICITEKIDGTNSCVIVREGAVVGVQSRSRIITPTDDNYGFARWVDGNKDALGAMGDGHHYGEWAGLGIQKNPLKMDRKRFFLFNVGRWTDERPAVCDLVPLLYDGPYSDGIVDATMAELWALRMAEFKKPEGVVIYFKGMRTFEKHTFEAPRGKWAEAAE